MLAHPDVCSLMNTKQLHEKKRNDTENVKEEKEKGKKKKTIFFCSKLPGTPTSLSKVRRSTTRPRRQNMRPGLEVCQFPELGRKCIKKK